MPALEPKNNILNLVQITDSHLFADPAGTLLGLPTSDSLKSVVDLVVQEQQGVDLVLATGDIAQDGSAVSYRRFVELVDPIRAPLRWLPGNHDEARVQTAVATGKDWSQPVVDMAGWRLVLLNSAVHDAVHGYLEQDQLDLLEAALTTAAGRHVMISLHHHPVPVGSNWLDHIGLRNADEFFAVVDRYATVRCVLWGHIHQEVDRLRNGVRLLATPSTCIQFAPSSKNFSLDRRLPGYRWLRLHPDGRVDTAVSRLQWLDHEIDYSGTGY